MTHALLASIRMPGLPPTDDLLRMLPVLILSGGFVVLLLLDLVTPPSARTALAALSGLFLAVTLGAVIWGWFDTAHQGLAYYGSYAYDRFSLFVDGIILASALVVVLISPGYLNRRGLHYGEYYALILGATVGMMLLAAASSLLVIFLGIELLSVSLYILCGFAHTEERSQESALKYLMLGGFASCFLLYGMALV
ncbi:MAG: hypothetical protein E6I76_02035 [Chloroflexi bacterium]|nr:MAG: hypothetical protein E6I76_02035 [Chloroflexota bacterium]